ncbi:FkbM family methyltransferase [Gymnodinialimonas hymeniacidonis]|uniref:FkbM family methyltransferase n=1 Tax=Gymnodinialimonas hymeniacidonis TaxID=3126508 RepID=UPI0034C6B532
MNELQRGIVNIRLDLIHRFRGDRFDFHGARIRVPKSISKSIRRKLLLDGAYETEEVEFVERYVEPGMDVIEFGGSIGAVASLIATRLGAGDSQYVVEASSELAELCRANVESNATDAHHVEVLHRAVSYNGTGVVRFATGRNAHIGHIARDGEEANEVPATTLSDVAAQLEDGRAFVFVCDIEGGEYDLFEKDLASVQKAKLSIVEFHPQDVEGRPVDIEAFLQTLPAKGLKVLEFRNDVAVIAPISAG